MRPVIGVTCCYQEETSRYCLAGDYVQAVKCSGGLPVILPHGQREDIRYLLDVLDGLLLSGGGDLDPFYFGEEPWPENGSIDPERDLFELELVKCALSMGMPVLGICRGVQVLNVAAGGGVCQDINRLVNNPCKHMQQAPRWYPTHSIKIRKDTLLFDILGVSKVRVNSFHHQMVGKLAPGFVIVAESIDGVIEAIEREEKTSFALGVQFHPENMWERYPVFLQLFVALVSASTHFAGRKKRLFTQDIVGKG